MSLICRLALLGLPPLDRTLIESLLQSDLGAGVAYEMAHDLKLADLIIANADDANTVRDLQMRGLPAPVVLIGESDAGTGWLVVARPIQSGALMRAVNHLQPQPGAGATRSARTAPSGTQPATRGPLARHREPRFEATVPFASLEMPGTLGAAGYTGFDLTQPFERSASGALTPAASMPRRAVQDDPIDARSVLMWRDAQASPLVPPEVTAASGGSPDLRLSHPVEPVVDAARIVAAGSGFPALAGFENTRQADLPEHAPVPGNWREIAQQQAQPRRAPAQPLAPEPENLSSSFADPADQPTLPPGVALAGPVQAILLVGEARLAGSSLIRALRGFGYRVDYVPDGEVALSRLASQDYGFAFLDAVSMGRQTLPVCRALRKRARALGQQHLHIVVIAKKSDFLRRLLARMAGCDAWMSLPLERRRLGQYLRSRT